MPWVIIIVLAIIKLNSPLAVIHKVDPDVICGHNFLGFDLDVLLHRMKANKVEFWSRLGRLKRSM